MATDTKDGLLSRIRNGQQLTARQQLKLTTQLSVPAILAQLSSIAMQYIDASMVGTLGANDSASIGIVSTTTWLFAGLCSAITTGFSVQVAHLIGANRFADARNVLRQSLITCLLVGLAMCAIGVAISGELPLWLGGSPTIAGNASLYFMIFSLCLPILTLDFLASGMLRSSGNMRTPSLLGINMCVLDVAFNFFFIFPTRPVEALGRTITVPGLGMGVLGAALGTMCAEVVTAVLLVYYLCFRSKELSLRIDSGSFRPTLDCLKRAVRISLPMGMQHAVICSAYIVTTKIVAPLGTIAIAANSFAITAESLCYMPGYGIADAATTLIGQSIGARRRELVQGFARITVIAGMAIMTLMGLLMYLGADVMIGIMSPVPDIVGQGAAALRIEAWAEPLFAASIVCYGIFVGAGDTVIPCIMNMASMWAVRLPLAYFLSQSMGLRGVWTAMCIELCVRGCAFLTRLLRGRWIKASPIEQPAASN